jgi:hypothetical protein
MYQKLLLSQLQHYSYAIRLPTTIKKNITHKYFLITALPDVMMYISSGQDARTTRVS